MKTREIRNVIPFTDIYYQNCYRILELTAFRYYGGNPLQTIINDIAIYNLVEENNQLSLLVDVKSREDHLEFLRRQGVQYDRVAVTSDKLFECIKESIAKDILVFVPINGKYYRHPFHDLFYGKENHLQPLLVIGYDDEKEIFKIIDINGMDWNTNKFCYEHEITYQDLLTCFNGVNDCGIPGFVPQVDLLSKCNDFQPTNRIVDLKSELITNYRDNKELILNGVEKLKYIADNAQRYDQSTTNAFTHKVSAYSNWYKFKQALGEEHPCVKSLYDTFDKWEIMEAVVYKCTYGEDPECKKLQKAFHEIYEIEQRMYESIYKL